MAIEPEIIDANVRTRRVDYALRLRRRVGGAVFLVFAAALISGISVATPWGQGVDTMMMEALSWHLDILHDWEPVARTIISLFGIALGLLTIGLFALARRRPLLAVRALMVVFVSNLLVQGLKWLLVRPDLGLTFVLPNSLPSGHVAIVSSLSVALVMVAPDYVRAAAAWLGWLSTSLIGVLVMVFQWHRVSDVLVSIMIVGACALVLAPIESRQRHFQAVHRIMSVMMVAALVVACVAFLAGTYGVDVWEAASTDGFGFIGYLLAHWQRAAVLSLAAFCAVCGFSAVVMHEVDRLSGPLRAA